MTNPADDKGRSRRKSLVGIVTSAKCDKTRRVEVPRLAKHGKYGKYLRKSTVCHVHDEMNESREGDQVEISETRPLSKTKRWRLVKVLRSRGADDLASPAEIAASAGEVKA